VRQFGSIEPDAPFDPAQTPPASLGESIYLSILRARAGTAAAR